MEGHLDTKTSAILDMIQDATATFGEKKLERLVDTLRGYQRQSQNSVAMRTLSRSIWNLCSEAANQGKEFRLPEEFAQRKNSKLGLTLILSAPNFQHVIFSVGFRNRS